jgi:hypothetical protein
MDIGRFIISDNGPFALAISDGLAECENNAIFHQYLRAWLHINITPFSSIEMPESTSGKVFASRDNCHKSLFVF